MSNISTAQSDFQKWEAQFSSPVAPATPSQLRVRGWAIALVGSLVLWAAIAVGIIAAIHAIG